MYHFKNPEDKVATISNLDAFLHRDLDTGFSSKWSGLWTPSYKLLDYYSYRINGVWLNRENLEAIDYGEEITYYFETSSISVSEMISAPEGFPGIKSKLKLENKGEGVKAVQIGLETGIDIREKSQDLGPKEYEVERNSSRIRVSSNKELKITSDRELLNSGETYIKTHYPGEEQRCLIPGEVCVRIELEPGEQKKVEFRFTSGTASDHIIQSPDSEIEGDCSRIFNTSINSTLNLLYDRDGLGVIAGHPWFQSYWARDTFWTLLGLIDAGYFEEAEKILRNFASRDLPGKINLEGEDEQQGRIDTYPLYIIAADKLRRHHKISETVEKGMKMAFEQLETEEGIVQHDTSGTWMDTLERDSAVDVQVLWLKAAEIMDEREEELREGLEKFRKDEYVKDHLGENPPHTINPAVGIMYGYFDEAYLSKINAEFSSLYGARTRSVTDPGYESSGYHSGSSWGLTTCWAAAANFEHGKKVEGLNFVDKLESLLDGGQPGALPEAVDSENGENLGCVEQAWSSGLVIHVIDSYLLGIQVQEDRVEIDPMEGYNGERLNKRIGNSFIDIKVENGKAEVMNDPDIDKEVII